MPRSPKRPCRYPGCPNLCESGVYCSVHAKEYGYDAIRGGASTRGYGARWRRARAAFLKQNPLCASCLKEGRITPATVVDHIIPHRGDEKLFWDASNWQALCKECHDKKTGHGM